MNKLSTSSAALAPISFAMKALLAAALLLAALLVPSASAQSNFIYVANAGEDTVSKIDATANVEVARYATWFNAGTNSLIATHSGNAWAGPAPSRIARDSAGNAYVLNRFFSTGTGGAGHTWSNPPHNPVLLKIAPSAGSPTSVGPVLSITDTNNNHDIDSGEAADKAILWAKSIGQASDDIGVGRAVAVDTTGNLWVGMYSTKKYYKVDAATGDMIPPTSTGVLTGSHRPYGCAIDVNGHLWSVDSGTTLAEIDTTNATYPVTIHPHSAYGTNYSLSIFNDCSTSPPKVKVYLSESYGKKTYIVYDPQTATFSNPPLTGNDLLNSVAVAVDSKGNIVSGDYLTGCVVKTAPSGSVLWNTKTLGTTQPTGEIHGIIIDKNDDVWVVDRVNGNVIKYLGANGTHPANGTVKVGNQPYTYGNTPPATCTGASTQNGDATFNQSKSDCAKGSICFDYAVPKLPNGTTGTVNLTLELYQNGALVTTLTSGPLTTSGTYCFTNFLSSLNASLGGFDWKMTANFTLTGTTIPPVVIGNTGEGHVPGNNNDCTIPPPPGCAQVTGEVRCLPNGGYSYTFTVTNNSGHAISQLLLTPVQGSTFTLAPQLATFSTPLQNGQSTTLTTTISGAKPGDKICFFISLLSDKDACCNQQVCLTMPQCGIITSPPPQLQRGKRRP